MVAMSGRWSFHYTATNLRGERRRSSTPAVWQSGVLAVIKTTSANDTSTRQMCQTNAGSAHVAHVCIPTWNSNAVAWSSLCVHRLHTLPARCSLLPASHAPGSSGGCRKKGDAVLQQRCYLLSFQSGQREGT